MENDVGVRGKVVKVIFGACVGVFWGLGRFVGGRCDGGVCGVVKNVKKTKKM